MVVPSDVHNCVCFFIGRFNHCSRFHFVGAKSMMSEGSEGLRIKGQKLRQQLQGEHWSSSVAIGGVREKNGGRGKKRHRLKRGTSTQMWRFGNNETPNREQAPIGYLQSHTNTGNHTAASKTSRGQIFPFGGDHGEEAWWGQRNRERRAGWRRRLVLPGFARAAPRRQCQWKHPLISSEASRLNMNTHTHKCWTRS